MPLLAGSINSHDVHSASGLNAIILSSAVRDLGIYIDSDLRFSHLCTTPTCDIQTDGQTDRQTDRRTDRHTMTANTALA